MSRVVKVDMPKIVSTLKRGDRLPLPRFMQVGVCEGVVDDVVSARGSLTVDLTIEVDGVYFAKIRGVAEAGKDPVWNPLRVEAQP